MTMSSWGIPRLAPLVTYSQDPKDRWEDNHYIPKHSNLFSCVFRLKTEILYFQPNMPTKPSGQANNSFKQQQVRQNNNFINWIFLSKELKFIKLNNSIHDDQIDNWNILCRQRTAKTMTWKSKGSILLKIRKCSWFPIPLVPINLVVFIKMMFRQLLIERRQELEERTLASSERGLGLLYESEKVRF